LLAFPSTNAMAVGPASLGVEVNDPPTDGISSLSFGKYSGALLATSWDGTVRVYDVDPESGASSLRHRFDTDVPVLSGCFANADDSAVVSGGLSAAVTYHDLATGKSSVVGTHDDAVRCVAWDPETGTIFSASWDQTISAWDVSLPASTRRVRTATLPGKAYAMDLFCPRGSGRSSGSTARLVLATSGGRIISVSPLQFMTSGVFEFDRASTLAHQTRHLACSPDGRGFVNASVEGRVAWERFDRAREDEQYAFKCHRTRVSDRETSEPDSSNLKKETETVPHAAHSAAFHPLTGAFATGGGDGFVNVWDGLNRKRVWRYPRYPASVMCVAFSEDGKKLAVATGRELKNETDETESNRDAVYVRLVQDVEVALKKK